jgi:hypothetical protein
MRGRPRRGRPRHGRWHAARRRAVRAGRLARQRARTATATGPPGALGLLQGDYQAWAIAFPDRDTGFVAISGSAGQSTTVRSWIERTTDGGRVWVAGRTALGQDQPGAQLGLAFVSAQQGWAYWPGLFFTRDDGVMLIRGQHASALSPSSHGRTG